MLEDIELIRFFEWVTINEKFDPRFKAIFHIANERKVSYKQGKLLKQKGVRAGVSDVCVAIPTENHPGMWIEFKVKPKRPTNEQVQFLQLMNSLGYITRIAWSCEEAMDFVREYLNDGPEDDTTDGYKTH